MPQRWERELRRLNGLRAPDGLRARVDEGPKGDALPPDPGRRQRLIAGVVAVVVFISAGAFAWRALQPAPTTPSVAGRAGGVDGTILWPERTQAALDATQSRANAGDPDVAWRLDPKAVATRFAEDVMGWRTPDGTYIVDVAGPPSPSGSIEVSLDRYAIPCPSPMPGGPPTGCPPPYEGERLTLVQAGAAGEQGIWSVAEVRASGFDLALHAGDLLSNGDSVSGHVTFPSTADAVPDFAAQSGFQLGTGPDCSAGTATGTRPGDVSIDVSVGTDGWTQGGCDATSPGFAYVATANVPPCTEAIGCPATVFVSGSLSESYRPLYGLTAVPMLVSVVDASTSSAPPPTTTPTVTDVANGRILFTVRDDSDGSEDVYSMAPNGTDVRPLLTGATDDSGAVWSPDGSMIAFVRVDRNGPCSDSNIYVADSDGSNQRQLTGSPSDLQCEVPSVPPGTNVSVGAGVTEDEPAWSPDGSAIAYRSNDCGIKVLALGRSEPVCLTPGGSYVGEPIWSPDGSRIAFDSDRGLAADAFGTDIWIMDADGTNLVRVTNDGGGNAVNGWSPDGTRLVYQRSITHSDYSWDVWTIGVDGKQPQQLTDWAGFDGSAVFSPDGRSIAFASDRFGDQGTIQQGEGGGYARELDVYTMPVAGGDAMRLTTYAPLVAWPTSWGAHR